MSRAVAEMMPDVTVPPRPNGLPMARTQSPTLALFESPQVAAGNGVFGSTLRSAKSVTASRPMTSACNVVSSESVTVICSALAITWLFVTMSPEGSVTKPEPSEAGRGNVEFGAPGAPFSPKKSRKNSSSGEPGGSCASGFDFGFGAALACVVEMFTTTPDSRVASCAKMSAKGVSGASARPGNGRASNSASKTVQMAPRAPKSGKTYLLLRGHPLASDVRTFGTGVRGAI